MSATVPKLEKTSSISPLWLPHIRDSVTLTKSQDAEVNARRTKMLVPGTPLPITRDESRVPVILGHNRGEDGGFAAGWDLIVPAGWGEERLSLASWLSCCTV